MPGALPLLPRQAAVLGLRPLAIFEAPPSAEPGYRRDIDGLRAVAVLAVILFHAAPWVPGGYVGVDVFFVISGFLITGQIASELDDGRFSLAAFWVRRVRRIWPAAFVMTCAVLAAGWLMLMPSDYWHTAKDAMAQALMVANIHLWKNMPLGYFAPTSDTRPLLHVWSLAVEEQFYVFLPLVMMALWRLGRNRCAWLLGIIAMASFTSSIAWLPSQPRAVFYLLPFRAWELLLGSLVALGMARPLRMADEATGGGRSLVPLRLLAEAGSMLGLCAILVCCFSYTKHTAFPAAAALPPCLGAALVITACGSRAGRAPLVKRMLSLQPLPSIGKLSYSLYLWHWPMLAFIRYCVTEPAVPSLVAMAALLPVSYLSWKWIEQPFRSRSGDADRVSPRRSMTITAWRPVLVGALAWAVVYAGGGLIARKGGIGSRLSPAERRFMESCKLAVQVKRFEIVPYHERESFLERPIPATPDRDLFPRLGAEAVVGRPDFLLWGDSHGQAIGTVIDSVARMQGVYGHAALMPGTPPLPGVWSGVKPSERLISEKWSRVVIDWIRTHRPRHILVCGYWKGHAGVQIDGSGRPGDIRFGGLSYGLQRLLSECKAVDARLTVMLQAPTQKELPAQRVLRAHLFGRAIDLVGIDRAASEAQQSAIVAAVEGVASDELSVINLADPFFGPNGMSSVGDDGRSWYFDTNHISAYGAERVLSATLGDLMEMLATERGDAMTADPPPAEFLDGLQRGAR